MNELIRRGLLRREDRAAFSQATRPLGLRIDVSNIGDALETLEGAAHR